jgi:hypothetical protein
MQRALIGVVALVVCLLVAPMQAATRYTFTRISDTSDPQLRQAFAHGVWAPQINNSGQIIFHAGFQPMVVLWDGVGLTPIINADGSFHEVYAPAAINDRGQVAFVTETPHPALWKWDRHKLRQLTDTSTPYTWITAPFLNRAGDVGFASYLADTTLGIFLSVNNNRVVEVLSGSPDTFFGGLLSDAGTILYARRGNQCCGIDAWMATDAKGRERTIVDRTTSLYAYLGNAYFTANDDIVFPARRRDTGQDLIVCASAGMLTEIMPAAPGTFLQIYWAAMNTSGAVAFFAARGDATHFFGAGIFDGPDPVANRVVFPGDVLDGDVVRGVEFPGNGAFNEQGQIVFTANFLTHSAIYRADPIVTTTTAP